MRKYAAIVFCVLLIVYAVPAFSQAQQPVKEPPKEQAKDVNISGTWDMTTQTPNGDMPGEVTFAQEKEVLKVTMSGPQGNPMSGEGTVKDGAVQWSLTFNGPNGDFTVVFKGKVDGEKITGDVQAGDFGSFPWVATKRKK